MNSVVEQDDKLVLAVNPMSEEDKLRFAMTDVEKVLESEILKLKEQKKQHDAVFFETKAQRDLLQDKLAHVCSRIDDLLKDVRCYRPVVETVVDISLSSDSVLTSIFEMLKATFRELHTTAKDEEKNDHSQLIVDLKKGHEEERQRLKHQIQTLCKEQEELRTELDDSKSHAFSLLQKLSCTRSEIISCKENHRKQVAVLSSSFESEKRNLNTNLFHLQSEKDKITSNLLRCNNEYALCQKNLIASRGDAAKLEESLALLRSENAELKKETVDVGSKTSSDSTPDARKIGEENDSTVKHLEKECERLRKHLLNMEETYTQGALEAENQKEELLREVDRLKSKLSTSLASAKCAESDYSKQHDRLNKLSEEKKDLLAKLTDSEKLVASYSVSIENLHAVLEQYEKNQQVLQLVELEKCKQDLKLESLKCCRLARENASVESELNEMKSQFAATKDLEEKFKVAATHISYLQYLVCERDESVKKLTAELAQLSEDTNAKVDKLIMKNMLMGYLHAPSSKKVEAFSVIGRFLDFSAKELAAINAMGTWTNSLKNQYSPIDHPNKEVEIQSFSELFIKFLEKESRPTAPILRLPTETDGGGGYHLHLYGRKDSSQNEPIQKFLQSLKHHQTGNDSSPVFVAEENSAPSDAGGNLPSTTEVRPVEVQSVVDLQGPNASEN